MLIQVVIFYSKLNDYAKLFFIGGVKLLYSRKSEYIIYNRYLNELTISCLAGEGFRRRPKLSNI